MKLLAYWVVNIEDSAEPLGFGGCPSLLTRFTPLRLRGGRTEGAGSSLLMARRWPSNTAVSQERSLSIKAAQIFAAAAASLNGPATSRNCMPSPLLRSFTTMIGRSEATDAPFDLRMPRHSARKPSIELAPP